MLFSIKKCKKRQKLENLKILNKNINLNLDGISPNKRYNFINKKYVFKKNNNQHWQKLFNDELIIKKNFDQGHIHMLVFLNT